MLANTLSTNEIKNAAGTEQEFTRLSQGIRDTTFAAINEAPSAPHRLIIKHVESGKGVDLRRRSLCRFDKTVTGHVDVTKSVVVSAYVVLDLPVGQLDDWVAPKDVLANLMSFMASLGATTTILYDGTGSGAATLLSGTL